MIKEGDLILLYNDERRNYLVKVESKKFHTDRGFLRLEETIGKKFGEAIETNIGERFFILRPSLYERVMKIIRKTQILYPKDIGMIIVKTNLCSGARVIEVGTGSGALTVALANLIKPQGKVYSYERNKEFLDNAIKNIEKNNLKDFVEFNHQEVLSEFKERDIDFVMIDIGSPWELIEAAYKSLKGGAFLGAICPTFEQLTKTVFELQRKGFVGVESMEILLRKILVRKGRTRPEQRIPSHTGWLVLGRKIIV